LARHRCRRYRFLHPAGQTLSNTQPCRARPDTLSSRIELYLELRDWPKRFANWIARRRLETLTTCAKRAAEAGRGLDAQRLMRLHRFIVKQATKRFSKRVVRTDALNSKGLRPRTGQERHGRKVRTDALNSKGNWKKDGVAAEEVIASALGKQVINT
jgi:hypothetical protein